MAPATFEALRANVPFVGDVTIRYREADATQVGVLPAQVEGDVPDGEPPVAFFLAHGALGAAMAGHNGVYGRGLLRSTRTDLTHPGGFSLSWGCIWGLMPRQVLFCPHDPDSLVTVPEPCHAEALALACTAYQFWLSRARIHGWGDRMEQMAVQVWLRSDGSVRDSVYVDGDEAIVVFDTTHLHAGEWCSADFVEVVARVAMEEVRT